MPAKIRDGGLYKIRSAFSGEVITFVTTDPEGFKIRTHLDTNADGQQWLATYIESDGYQEKFFTFKSMQKSAGMDYYIGCPVPDGEQPIIPKTTADKPDDWTLASEGGAMYRICANSGTYRNSAIMLKNGIEADDDATLQLGCYGDHVNDMPAMKWIFEEIPMPGR